MTAWTDGAVTPLFSPVEIRGNARWADLQAAGVSAQMAAAAKDAPTGRCVFRGLPLSIGARPVVAAEGGKACRVRLPGLRGRWIVLAHVSDLREIPWNKDGVIEASTGQGRLGEHAADYVMEYADGTELRIPVRRRREIGTFQRRWGENCTEAVEHGKPGPIRPEQAGPGQWGRYQTRADARDMHRWSLWLWAWENPHPASQIVALRVEPVFGAVTVCGLSCGNASENPLRWGARQKAVLRLPRGTRLDPVLDGHGNLAQVRLDLGAVISAVPRLRYPDPRWPRTGNNELPEVEERELLLEYAAHPDARFHLTGGKTVPVARLLPGKPAGALSFVRPAERRVRLRVVPKDGSVPVAVKLHVHGESGEWLPPLDRHRLPNSNWFEDYAPEFQHRGIHDCVYVPGETELRLPLGRVFVEVSKGFEIRPVRRVFRVTSATREIVIELEKVLPWREKGWVSADTHVHFLSPTTGLLEGAGEGVNVVNLLASQWGELMTNSGDFDGKTVHGSREAGGTGEYLLRVGSENRHHVLGHISLLGYNGPLISPMTSGGPDESAIGDPVEVLLTEWARQCKKQGGLVVLPHFPNPRLENAAAIVDGGVDAVEMTSWGNLYMGIDPYSLSDWYRYLNNGYMLAAVGGTDKMGANTAVGAVRTYARIADGREFTYDGWMEAVRRAETFVTYGPLLEMSVDGHPMGSRIAMGPGGGTVEVAWKAASLGLPMTRMDLIANGVILESAAVDPEAAEGVFKARVGRSTWLALLVRGRPHGKPEIVAAHSSPVMVEVRGTPFYKAADAMTILQQIEGALAYLDTVGTRAETAVYRRMRLTLTAAHRSLHNRMHEGGVYHGHTPVHHHKEHGE